MYEYVNTFMLKIITIIPTSHFVQKKKIKYKIFLYFYFQSKIFKDIENNISFYKVLNLILDIV